MECEQGPLTAGRTRLWCADANNTLLYVGIRKTSR